MRPGLRTRPAACRHGGRGEPGITGRPADPGADPPAGLAGWLLGGPVLAGPESHRQLQAGAGRPTAPGGEDFPGGALPGRHAPRQSPAQPPLPPGRPLNPQCNQTAHSRPTMHPESATFPMHPHTTTTTHLPCNVPTCPIHSKVNPVPVPDGSQSQAVSQHNHHGNPTTTIMHIQAMHPCPNPQNTCTWNGRTTPHTTEPARHRLQPQPTHAVRTRTPSCTCAPAHIRAPC